MQCNHSSFVGCGKILLNLCNYQWYIRISLSLECDKTYGPGCTETCGHCFDSKPCHHINGSCVNGCAPGFLGDTCIKGIYCYEQAA